MARKRTARAARVRGLLCAAWAGALLLVPCREARGGTLGSDCVVGATPLSQVVAAGDTASFSVQVFEGSDPSFACSSANWGVAEISDSTGPAPGSQLVGPPPGGPISGGPQTVASSPATVEFTVPVNAPGGTVVFTVTCTAGCDFESQPVTVEAQVVNVHELSIAGVSQLEGTGGTPVMTFTVSRPGTAGNASVEVDTADGTAIAGPDYTAIVDQLVTIPHGSNAVTFDVAIVGDAEPEADESFTVLLSNPINAVLVTTSAEGEIVNDDSPIAVPVSAGALLLLALALAGVGVFALRR